MKTLLVLLIPALLFSAAVGCDEAVLPDALKAGLVAHGTAGDMLRSHTQPGQRRQDATCTGDGFQVRAAVHAVAGGAGSREQDRLRDGSCED